MATHSKNFVILGFTV